MKTHIKLSLLLLALLLSATATAHQFEVDGIYYNVNGNNATVTFKGSYSEQYSNEYTGYVTIPATVNYGGTTYDVTSIGHEAFWDCNNLTSITIPNSVTLIGVNAFRCCTSLSSITIPNSVTEIGFAFGDCTGLTSIQVENGNPKYDSRNNCNAIIETSTNSLITGCMNTVIPNSITSIGDDAFYGCSGLTSITIPNSVTEIGNMAFSASGLSSITIPNSVTTIGDDAFLWCFNLTSITIPSSVSSIGYRAFVGCCYSLTSIQVENDNPNYDSRNNCNAIIQKSTNTLIVGCMNTIIPNSVTSIGEESFRNCAALTDITIPNSVTKIGYQAFRACTALTDITIPNSVTSIASCVFEDCNNLTCVTIPCSVTEIGEEFYGCDNLTTIFLTGEGEWTAGAFPYHYNEITLYVDNGITGVKGIKEKPKDVFSFSMTPPVCDENSFTDYSGTLHVPAASIAAYFTAPYWCNFANIVGDAVKPNGLNLDKDSIELIVPEMTSLEAAITPASATSNIIAWASSNPAVATVDNGQVTAVGYGECDIVAMCLDQRAVCHVTVYSDRISVDQEQLQVLPNHIVALTPTSLATELPALVVTSSDPTVAAARVMNGKVQVVGVSEGTATITVSAADGTAKPATCLVTVYTEQGDTNGDGYIDIDDVTALIEGVLGNKATSIKEKNADLNDDGIMDIDDVTALINTILGNN